MNTQAQRGPPSDAEERNPAVHARDGPEQVVELSLTELYPFKGHAFIPEILEMVDEGKIAFRPAVEISYLTELEQKCLGNIEIQTMRSPP